MGQLKGIMMGRDATNSTTGYPLMLYYAANEVKSHDDICMLVVTEVRAICECRHSREEN